MFQEPVKLFTLNTNVKTGSYAFHKKPVVFETCRERFATSWTKNSRRAILYKHEPNQSTAIASFILKTEAILNIKRRSTFACTNCDTVLWVKPCYFWRICRIRRSLFTILLRAGMTYNVEQDNYEFTLFNHEYLISTQDAVKRFLCGFCDYTGPNTPFTTVDPYGWRCTFSNLQIPKIKNYLVSKKCRKVPSALDFFLWV